MVRYAASSAVTGSTTSSSHTADTASRRAFSARRARDRAPIAFYEKHDDLVGPLFNFSIKGTF